MTGNGVDYHYIDCGEYRVQRLNDFLYWQLNAGTDSFQRFVSYSLRRKIEINVVKMIYIYISI